jgi:uncharacterized protein YndB with AHSA1/START domain
MPSATEPLRHEVRIAAPPEIVFAYFTDPARLVEWIGIAALLDPRPGGTFRVEANGRDVVCGEYVEVEPPRRVVFTWGFEEADGLVPPGASIVEITLTPDGDGTLLRLTHRDLPGPSRPQHDQGWEHFLDRLRSAAAGADPGPDPWGA